MANKIPACVEEIFRQALTELKSLVPPMISMWDTEKTVENYEKAVEALNNETTAFYNKRITIERKLDAVLKDLTINQ